MGWLSARLNAHRLARAATPSAGKRHRVAGGSLWAAKRAAWLLVAIGLVVVGYTASDYGVAWDDSVQTRYGSMVLDYFLTAGNDRACNELLDLRLYGPPVELVGAVLARLAPHRLIEMRHLLTALIALLSIPALYRFGRLLGNPWLGVFAAITLLLTPRFYGHAFVNTKDMPFAIGMVASIGALSALLARRQYRWREIIECGLLLGCTVAVRPGGWLLLGPIYLLGAMFVDWQSRRARTQSGSKLGHSKRRSLTKQGVMFTIAWIVMVACWPWAHESPISNPLQAIRMSMKFHIVVPVLFDGQMMMSDALPRTYLVKYILITTPLTVLGLAGIGIATAARRLLRGLDHRRAAIYWMLLVWLSLPLVLFFVMRPNAYDGMRHFLFLLPAIALLAAIGMQTLFAGMPGMKTRVAVGLAVAILLTMQLGSILQLHPYQIAYFNRLVGGTAAATGQYDTEYWMTSYREAMEWIRTQPTRDDGRPVRVLVAANENSRWCAEYYGNDDVEIVTTLKGSQPGHVPDEFTYYLGTTRSLMSNNFPASPVVKQVERAGAVFAVVKQRTVP